LTYKFPGGIVRRRGRRSSYNWLHGNVLKGYKIEKLIKIGGHGSWEETMTSPTDGISSILL
jgi:hypothetical protein